LKDSLSNRNPFERGSTDLFEFRLEDLGDIERIKFVYVLKKWIVKSESFSVLFLILFAPRVGHDNSKLAAGWHLDKVIIKRPDQNKQWLFVCNKWLDKQEGDRKIERELYPFDEDLNQNESISGNKSPIRSKYFDNTQNAIDLNRTRLYIIQTIETDMDH
jgi:hypothetical protein